MCAAWPSWHGCPTPSCGSAKVCIHPCCEPVAFTRDIGFRWERLAYGIAPAERLPRLDPPRCRRAEGLREALQVVRQGVDVLGAAEPVGAVAEHGEIVAALGEVAIHDHRVGP